MIVRSARPGSSLPPGEEVLVGLAEDWVAEGVADPDGLALPLGDALLPDGLAVFEDAQVLATLSAPSLAVSAPPLVPDSAIDSLSQ